MINIALAEDNSFLANSIAKKLELFEEFHFSFHSLNGQLLLENLKIDNQVDILLMDIQMPVMNGIQATAEVMKLYPQIKIIMLTILDSEQSIYEAIQAGAIGYLLKESSPQELYDGIKEAMKGGGALSPSIALKAMKIIQNPNVINKDKVDYNLTSRELDVLKQLSKGLGYKQIAINLHISPNTVRRHTENIYRKLKVKSKVEAVQLAHQNNLI